MSIKSDADKKIHSIINSLARADYKTDQIIEKQFHYETTIHSNGDKAKLLVYFGKKGVKVVLQGNTESKFYHSVNSLVTGEPLLEFKNPEPDEPDNYIGTDESGKGDYFGPLVIAAVYITKEQRAKLLQFDVRDSKELSDTQINVIAPKILKVIGDNYELLILEPEEYNSLYEKFKNLNKLLNWAHSRVITKLYEKTGCTNIIVDKFSKTELNVESDKNYQELKIIQTVKAERFTAVAAASILARNSFNKWFEQKEKQGFNLLKGAAQEVEETAKRILKNEGEEFLANLVKLHFKTTKKINNF